MNSYVLFHLCTVGTAMISLLLNGSLFLLKTARATEFAKPVVANSSRRVVILHLCCSVPTPHQLWILASVFGWFCVFSFAIEDHEGSEEMEREQGQDGLDEFSGAQQSCDGQVAMHEKKRDNLRHYKLVLQH